MKKVFFQLGPFSGGIDNINDVRSLDRKILREAIGIDIDNSGFINIQPSVTEVHSTGSRSLFGNADGSIGLVAEGSLLRRINSDDTRTTIYSGLNATTDVCYWEHLGIIYFSDGKVIGKTDGYTVSLLASQDDRPFKETMRAGSILAVHNDRLYSIIGGRILFSDAKSLETMDRRFCRLYVDGNVIMFYPVADGIWLSFGGKTYFVSGLDPADSFQLIEKADYSALGQAIEIRKELLIPALQGFGGKVIAWMSEKGLCIGGDGGTMLNLSARKYTIPTGMRRASSILRVKNNGIAHIITVMTN